MLIGENIVILNRVLDLILVHVFQFQILIGLKMLPFLDFWSKNSSSVHIGNKKKYILVLGNGPTQGLDDTTITAEA